jgi:hydrophobic/amphiphilic exporter-1 (mainly G- bacteria), HAE1 family
MKRWLPSLAYDHPVTVLMIFVAAMLLGMLSWQRIPLQLMPEGFEPSFLWVGVPYGRANPEEIDREIVRPFEEQLGTVSGIKSIRSRARSGMAGFYLRFHQSADMDAAYNAVTDRLERARAEMPEDVDRFWIYRYNPDDDPIAWIGVRLPETVSDPYHLLERVVKPSLERLPGVAAVDFYGVPRRAVYVDYDKDSVYAHGVDLGDLTQRINSASVQMSAGELQSDTRVLNLRSLSRMEGVDELAAFPVKEGVTLSDIADVRLRAAYSTTIQRVDGEEAAFLAVRKEARANTVDVSKRVEAALAELASDPRVQGMGFFTLFSSGTLVQESVDNLTGTALTGGLFALVVLFVFLREWRMTLLIAASIPFSLLLTVAVLYATGKSLNLISLMGLMLAVGMVVDNAIVVVETIYSRRAQGAATRAAAIGGTGEVGLAITLSTLTTMVVFLPVILMSEDAMFSFFMGELGLPVVYALAASLLVALVFAPLATRYIGAAHVRPDPVWLQWTARGYDHVLKWVLTKRADSGMALLALTLLTLGVAMPGVRCQPEMDQNLNDFAIRFTVPPVASMPERDAIVRHFEGLVDSKREAWGVRASRSELSGDRNRGEIEVYLESDGPMERDEVMEEARELMPTDMPGVRGGVGWGSLDGDGEKQVILHVNGEDTETLRGLAAEVARRVEEMPHVLAVHLDENNDGADEIRLVTDRDSLARFDVSASQVGRLLAYAMRGTDFPELAVGNRKLPVQAAFSLKDRSRIDTLLGYELWSPAVGGLVPIRAVTNVEFAKGPHSIVRNNRKTSATVTVELKEDATADDGFRMADAALADMAFPRGYGWSKGERHRDKEEGDAATALALLLSMCFVFLLMGMLFESFVLPMSIITTVPMAMAGAMWLLYVTDTPMDTMAGVGLVILVGVVVNNGIVLIDLVTQLQREGLDRVSALRQAGSRRLRPILMTALTTIFGLLPMALGAGSFVGVPYAPLGRTVIGGLIAATLLTLVFVPYLYTVLDDMRIGGMRWMAWVRGATT